MGGRGFSRGLGANSSWGPCPLPATCTAPTSREGRWTPVRPLCCGSESRHEMLPPIQTPHWGSARLRGARVHPSPDRTPHLSQPVHPFQWEGETPHSPKGPGRKQGTPELWSARERVPNPEPAAKRAAPPPRAPCCFPATRSPRQPPDVHPRRLVAETLPSPLRSGPADLEQHPHGIASPLPGRPHVHPGDHPAPRKSCDSSAPLPSLPEHDAKGAPQSASCPRSPLAVPALSWHSVA